MTTNKEEHQLTMSEIPEGPFNPAPASTTPCEPTASDVLCGRGGTINTQASQKGEERAERWRWVGW